MRRPSVGPPQIARSGCSTSTASVIDEVAEVEAGELALPGGDGHVRRRPHLRQRRAGRRRSPAPRTSARRSGSMPAAKRLASATLNVPWASTISSTSGAERRAGGGDPGHARRRRSPSITPTRIFTAPNPAATYAPQLVADAVGVGPPAAGVQRHVAAARAAPQVDDRRAEGAAEEIPQRHVDAAHRRHRQPAPPEDREDPTPGRGVAGRAVRCTCGRPTSLIRRASRPTSAGPSSSLMQATSARARSGAADGGLGLAPADGAVVGLDAHERHVEAGDAPEVGDVLALRRDRAVQPPRLDVADDHERPSDQRQQRRGALLDEHAVEALRQQAAAVVDDELQLLGADVDRVGLEGVGVAVGRRAVDRGDELDRQRAVVADLLQRARRSPASRARPCRTPCGCCRRRGSR